METKGYNEGGNEQSISENNWTDKSICAVKTTPASKPQGLFPQKRPSRSSSCRNDATPCDV